MTNKDYFLARQGVDFDKQDHLKRISEAFTQGHDWPLEKHILYAAYIGSRSHGTYIPPTDPNSVDDIDIMMIVSPPIQNQLGLSTFDNWSLQQDELDVVAYSVQKFTRLLLKNNPNVVGLLWLPDDLTLVKNPMWDEWVKQREIFSSLLAHTSFTAYAKSQIHKLDRPGERTHMGKKRGEIFDKFHFDVKNASHAIRLLRMGIEFVETGKLNVDRRGIDADEIKSIKQGKWTIQQVQAEADKEFERIIKSKLVSPLPEKPDAIKAEALLLRTTLKLWGLQENEIKQVLGILNTPGQELN